MFGIKGFNFIYKKTNKKLKIRGRGFSFIVEGWKLMKFQSNLFSMQQSAITVRSQSSQPKKKRKKKNLHYNDRWQHVDLKQTATFFNPTQLSQQSTKNSTNQSQRNFQRPPLEQTFKPSELKKPFIAKDLLKRSNGTLRNLQSKQTQSLQKLQQKLSSPVKRTLITKPYSPPQPKTQETLSPMYNQSVVHLNPGPIRAQKIVQIQGTHDLQIQMQRKIQQNKIVTQQDEFRGEISMVDCLPFNGKIQTTNQQRLKDQQMENEKRLVSVQDYHQQKSSSVAFLPKIGSQSKLVNNLYGYGSVSQETGVKSTSSKQNISNEFLSVAIMSPEESLLRKSKTAQETLRESQQQIKQIKGADIQESLPIITSPQSGTHTGFDFGQKQKKSFLLRKPQAKIVSRLFSSKSDNN
ncbi:hypothetical protein pb186bvf_016321 [Paramecium bursaria]